MITPQITPSELIQVATQATQLMLTRTRHGAWYLRAWQALSVSGNWSVENPIRLVKFCQANSIRLSVSDSLPAKKGD